MKIKYIFLGISIISAIMEYYCLFLVNILMTVTFGLIGISNIILFMYWEEEKGEGK